MNDGDEVDRMQTQDWFEQGTGAHVTCVRNADLAREVNQAGSIAHAIVRDGRVLAGEWSRPTPRRGRPSISWKAHRTAMFRAARTTRAIANLDNGKWIENWYRALTDYARIATMSLAIHPTSYKNVSTLTQQLVEHSATTSGRRHEQLEDFINRLVTAQQIKPETRLNAMTALTALERALWPIQEDAGHRARHMVIEYLDTIEKFEPQLIKAIAAEGPARKSGPTHRSMRGRVVLCNSRDIVREPTLIRDFVKTRTRPLRGERA